MTLTRSESTTARASKQPRLALKLVMMNYDHLAPLAAGDVEIEGIDLTLERDTENAINRALNDPSTMVGEYSFSRHLIRVADGDRSVVAIPVFPYRAFRHRCLFVRGDSDLTDLSSLAGKRVGIDEWPATGNTWTRAAIREAGVAINSIRWSAGTFDGAPTRPQGVLPAYVTPLAPGQTLYQMLLDGEIDALMRSVPPPAFYTAESPVRRLLPDFRRAEQEYYRRTGLYPVQHVIGIKRDLLEREPWVARSLYLALERSKALWQAGRRRLNDTTPWLLAEIEAATELIGDDWHPYGVEPNRVVMQALADELYAQNLVNRPIDAVSAFEDFERIMSAWSAG